MELLSVFFWYLLPLSIYLSGYITMRPGLKKYDARPAYAPPGWFIAAMWFVLYMLQGTAAWLLMRDNADAWTYELTMFCVFLGMSALYGPIFSRRNNRLTFFYTFVLFAYSAVIVGFFFKKYAWSGWIFLPTVIWLAFATWLSFNTFQNRRYSSSSNSTSPARRRSNDSDEESWVGTNDRQTSARSDSDDDSDDDSLLHSVRNNAFSRLLRRN